MRMPWPSSGSKQHARIGRETGPAVDLALGDQRPHALDHGMMPGTSERWTSIKRHVPDRLPSAQHLFGEVRPTGDFRVHGPHRHQRSAAAAEKLDPLDPLAARCGRPTQEHEAIVVGRVFEYLIDAVPGVTDFQVWSCEGARPRGRPPGPTWLPARRRGRRGACGSPGQRRLLRKLPGVADDRRGRSPERPRHGRKGRMHEPMTGR